MNMINIKNLGVVILALFLLPNTVLAEWSEWIADGAVKVENGENVNRSAFSNDEEDDTTIFLDGSVGRNYQINNTLRLRLTADASYEKWDEFDGLDGYSLGGSAKLRKKFGVGPDKLWMNIGVSYKDESRDESLWEVSAINSELRLGRNFTPRWGAWVGYQYYDKSGDTDVFDEQMSELSAGTHYAISQQLQVSLRVDAWQGDFHSACTVGNVAIAIMIEGDNIRDLQLDPVFGGCVYSVNGDGENASVDLIYSFDRHSSIQFAYDYHNAEADVLEYDNSEMSLRYRYRH